MENGIGAFSGDTTPCDNLIKLSQGADILVHEVIHKPSLARLMAGIPNADRLAEHIMASHTTHLDVGKVAKAAGVKTRVLTHFVPSDDLSLTDEMWLEGANSFRREDCCWKRPDGDLRHVQKKIASSSRQKKARDRSTGVFNL